MDEKQYVHMLNGTLCATERTMCCIVENYQTPEGVKIPEVLQPYMHGITFLPYSEVHTKKFFDGKEAERVKEAAAAKKKGGKKEESKK